MPPACHVLIDLNRNLNRPASAARPKSRRRGRWNCITLKALEVKSNNNNRAAPGVDLKTGGGDSQLFTPRCLFHTCAAPLRARFVRSPSLFVLNVRRCDRRAHRTAFAHGIDRVCSGAFLHGAPRALLHLRREHMRHPLSPLTTVGLSACLFSQSRAAADQVQFCLPPLHPRALHCT